MTDQPSPQNWEDFKKEVGKQSRQQAAKWLIAGVSALIVFALTGWWFYLSPKIDAYIASRTNGLPVGAVVAFHSSESITCPGDEWKLFDEAKGRFIVGAGQPSSNRLTSHRVGDIGGEERVTLSKPQIPKHTHALTLGRHWGDRSVNIDKHGWGGDGNDQGGATRITNNGIHDGLNNQSHNNMPPFIALYFCKKL